VFLVSLSAEFKYITNSAYICKILPYIYKYLYISPNYECFSSYWVWIQIFPWARCWKHGPPQAEIYIHPALNSAGFQPGVSNGWRCSKAAGGAKPLDRNSGDYQGSKHQLHLQQTYVHRCMCARCWRLEGTAHETSVNQARARFDHSNRRIAAARWTMAGGYKWNCCTEYYRQVYSLRKAGICTYACVVASRAEMHGSSALTVARGVVSYFFCPQISVYISSFYLKLNI
jgi:hypothetical protein